MIAFRQFISLVFLILIWICSCNGIYSNSIHIYHLIDNALWGEVDGSYLKGIFPCGAIECLLVSTDPDPNYPNDTSLDILSLLKNKYQRYHQLSTNTNEQPVTVGLYNIHSYKAISNRPYRPNRQMLPTTYNIAESEESFGRFGHLFQMSFSHYDGNSTTHPSATIPRSYINIRDIINGNNTNSSSYGLLPLKEFRDLIPAAVYVASTCHRHSNHGYNRDHIVKQLKEYIRVDGLGKCHHSIGSEGIVLSQGQTPWEALRLKQYAINHYMFYFAFENTIERGYVTEKVLDALVAGVVPIYIGAAVDCKTLLPLSDAIIYFEDFNNDVEALTTYLSYLMNNETAYEIHRQWRNHFQISQLPSMLTKSWPCRICEWAHERVSQQS